MCGISGIYNRSGKQVDCRLLEQMTTVIRHRGPDDEGYLLINTGNNQARSCFGIDTQPALKSQLRPLQNEISANLAFSNRRLAILDLSPKGHQPMTDAEKKVWITYNGEIYNYKELREELSGKGYRFETFTDTEVILNAYLEWGVDCQKRFRGMWAFALWDSSHKRLFCSRDRFGIKPFYYHYDGERFLFGSELKQLLISGVSRRVNERMLHRLLKMGSFLYYDDESLFEKIRVLPHSHYLILDQHDLLVSRYYDLPVDRFESSCLGFSEAAEEYRTRLTESVQLHLRSDVEVGSCLSGGLDSSAIVALASGFKASPIKTFTAYYTDPPNLDERKWIDELKGSCSIDDYYISPDVEDFISDFCHITKIQEYPLIGSSPISQYYVMKLASTKGIKVVLDGQGSDEINIGYAHSFYRYYADLLSNGKFKTFYRQFKSYLQRENDKTRTEKLLKTLLVILFPESFRYQQEIRFNTPNLLDSEYPARELIGNLQDLPISKLSTFLYHLIMTIYLQSLLHFEDRNSMAFSIESRVPFLDHQLVEFVLSLPAELRVEGGWNKKLHRQGMEGVVPATILNREDKVNFATPAETQWLKAGMKDFLQSVIQSSSFRQRGVFNHHKVEKLYHDFLKGKNSNGHLLWKVMAIEIWFQQFVD